MKLNWLRISNSHLFNLSTSIWNLRIYWALCGIGIACFFTLALMSALSYLLTGAWLDLVGFGAWVFNIMLWVSNAFGAGRVRKVTIELEKAEAHIDAWEKRLVERYPGATPWLPREH